MCIFVVLWGTYKILRAIDSLFNSSFFQSLLVDGKSMSRVNRLGRFGSKFPSF